MTIKSKIGRPSLYTQEIQDKADDYILKFIENNPSNDENSETIMSVEGLCIYLGIGQSTAYDWSKEEGKEAFSDTLKEIKLRQKNQLVNKSLKNIVNPMISKTLLAVNHDVNEKQIIEQTNIYDNMTEEELRKIAEE